MDKTAYKIGKVPWLDVIGKPQAEGASANSAFDNLGKYDVKLTTPHLITGQRAVADNIVPDGAATTYHGETITEAIPNYRAVVRGKLTGDEETNRVFGMVSGKYHLVTPQNVVDLWDKHTGLPVSNIGFTDHGERFFVAAKLPSSNIQGDEIANTLVIISPMNGRESITGMLVPVRLVCANGMVSYDKVAASFSMKHYQRHMDELPEWLNEIYENNIVQIGKTELLYEALADRKLSDNEVHDIIYETFPYPIMPQQADKETRKHYEKAIEVVRLRQKHAKRLFRGGAIGYTKPMENSAYGLFNSVVELLDHGVAGEVKRSTSRSAGFGAAAKAKRNLLGRLSSLVETAA